ncbi:MAG: hypothetical protein K5770_16590, partial [Lachnospiraceae bacterium]|nr:hypothetical protein [Lachnospiraceae bacterium]
MKEGGRMAPDMNRRGPAPSAPQSLSVGSFGGSPQAGTRGMNATERRAAEIARNRQAAGDYREKKKGGVLVPILIVILVILIILAVLAIRILL